ncbi:MAG: 30S ribosomal protein S11 [Oligoflexia bacterium]|nr:30S ribosomal protein S11 [Bdellovibrionales bacterium]MYE07511.1 30S ribosomal protein S11 [Oligoflexia bacterium]
MSVRKPKKKKEKKNIPKGNCYIYASFGNTQVSFTDPGGQVICWSSSGVLGFKGSRKGTPFVAQAVAEDAVRRAQECGVKTVNVFLKGPGTGREMAVRTLASAGLKITSLRDITPIPHNGCRPPKRRRV